MAKPWGLWDCAALTFRKTTDPYLPATPTFPTPNATTVRSNSPTPIATSNALNSPEKPSNEKSPKTSPPSLSNPFRELTATLSRHRPFYPPCGSLPQTTTPYSSSMKSSPDLVELGRCLPLVRRESIPMSSSSAKEWRTVYLSAV